MEFSLSPELIEIQKRTRKFVYEDLKPLEVEVELAELAEMMGDELELPNIEPRGSKQLTTEGGRYTGIRAAGPRSLRHSRRTFRRALKRTIAGGDWDPSDPRVIPIGDDERFRARRTHPEPESSAVIFHMMDVSGSMGEREKDLAKRFFILLHLFLKRRYKRIDVIFVRHTHEAKEVDEQTFFYSRETGGTEVSTALTEMLKIVRDRYPPSEWNIYAAQASDGENYASDADRCIELLGGEVMPLCQYYAYVEILDEREMEIFRNSPDGTALWRAYRGTNEEWPNFEMKRIAEPGDIYPVFRELFSNRERQS